jgi:hypothetical protein
MLTFNNPDDEQKQSSDLEIVTKKLEQRNLDVIELQKKVIDLYEEIRHVHIS